MLAPPPSPAGDGEIQIDELVDNMDVLIKYSVDGAKLQDAFQKLDLNGDGFIRQDDSVAMRAPPRRPLVTRLVSVCDKQCRRIATACFNLKVVYCGGLIRV